jgi:hypothetical protein
MLAKFTPGNDYRSLSAFWVDTPGDAWQAARDRAFQERRIAYWFTVLAFLALLAVAVRGQPYWTALVLGVGFIPMVADITCYYYGILLVYAFLSDRYPSIGVGLLAFSAFTLVVAPLTDTEELRYTIISLGLVLYVFAATAVVAWSRRGAVQRQKGVPQVAA